MVPPGVVDARGVIEVSYYHGLLYHCFYDLLLMCRSHFLLLLQTMTTLTAVSNVEDMKNLFLAESEDCYSRLRNRYEYSRHRIALVVFSSDCFIVDIGRSKGRGRCRVYCKDRRGELRG